MTAIYCDERKSGGGWPNGDDGGFGTTQPLASEKLGEHYLKIEASAARQASGKVARRRWSESGIGLPIVHPTDGAVGNRFVHGRTRLDRSVFNATKVLQWPAADETGPEYHCSARAFPDSMVQK